MFLHMILIRQLWTPNPCKTPGISVTASSKNLFTSFLGALHEMGGSNGKTLAFNGVIGAAETMLIRCESGVMLTSIQAHGRAGSEFKGVFRCWRIK